MLPAYLDDAPPLTDDDLDALFDWEDLAGPDAATFDPASSPGEAAVEVVKAWNAGAPAQRWQVADMPSAEWAMRRYATLDAEISEKEHLAADWIDQVRQWLDRTRRPLVRRRDFFEHHLTDYALRWREQDPKRNKTLNLPSGDVPTRLVPARPEVQDDEAFVTWAHTNAPSAIKSKWSPVAAEVKGLVEFLPAWVENGRDDINGAVVSYKGCLIAVPMEPDLQARLHDGDFTCVHEETLPLRRIMPLVRSVDDETVDRAMYMLVPGVVQVPETIKVSVKPGRK